MKVRFWVLSLQMKVIQGLGPESIDEGKGLCPEQGPEQVLSLQMKVIQALGPEWGEEGVYR